MTHHIWTQLRGVAEMIIITALVVIFVRNVAITYTVNGPSMEPSFQEDHRVLVNRLGAVRFWGISLYGQPDFLFEGPERGDIIVFEPQQPGTEKIVKRVVGLPGDKVDIYGDQVAPQIPSGSTARQLLRARRQSRSVKRLSELGLCSYRRHRRQGVAALLAVAGDFDVLRV